MPFKTDKRTEKYKKVFHMIRHKIQVDHKVMIFYVLKLKSDNNLTASAK